MKARTEMHLIVDYDFTRCCEAGDISDNAHQKFKGHINLVFGAIHLVCGERMMTGSNGRLATRCRYVN